MADTDWNERYLKRGDPTKPTYYIIYRKDANVGLFSNFIVFSGHIRYALSKGWIPVIDMQNYPNNCLSPEKLGKKNLVRKTPGNIILNSRFALDLRRLTEAKTLFFATVNFTSLFRRLPLLFLRTAIIC